MSKKAMQASVKMVRGLIKQVGTALASLEEIVQTAAIACVNHAREYGDVTLAGELINEVSQYKAYNALLLQKWFKAHGPFEFEMSADKTTVENTKMERNAKGEQAKAFALNADLERDPVTFAPQPKVKGPQTKEPTPISYKWFQDQIGKLEAKLAKAIEPDGQGILVGMDKNGKPIIAHKNNKNYSQFFQAYSTYIRGVKDFATKVVELPTANLAVDAATVQAKVIQQATHDAPIGDKPAELKAETPARNAGRGKQRKAA